MSFQLILGGSGSGKSYFLYTWIIREAMRHPDKNYIVMVPEQFTMQTQRELVGLHPKGGILNIDVQSFERLAARVLHETGADHRTVLTETGKNLLLRRVAALEEERLQVMKSRLNRPGYLSEIKSLISELTQYGFAPEDMEDMIRLAKERPQLQCRLQDVRVLYESFRRYQTDRFITAEEVLDVFCQAAEDSGLLSGSILVFDGFTGFTPVQQKALERLFELSSDIKAAITLREGESFVGSCQEHDLFGLSKKTIQLLLRMAKESGTQVLEPVMLTAKKGRHLPGSALQFLERRLFSYGKRERWNGDCGQEITLRAEKNPAGEVVEAARTICRLTREDGLRCRQIAVIAGDLPSYGNYIKKIFEEYEIPFFLDQTVQILLNPSLEFIRGAFAMVDTGFSYEGVFRFLRSGYAGLSREETDRLENYVLALGIRGRSRWEQEWTGKTYRMEQEAAEECDRLRRRLMENLQGWLAVFEKRSAPLQDYAMALYSLLASFRIQEQLKLQEDDFTRRGLLEKAREYAQIYGVIIQLLDEAVELLGEETVTRREFEDILEAGFSEARVGLIPPGIDQVHVGDMERTRLNDIKVLFFLGVNDGWIPSREGRGGIVSQLEREFLKDAGIELAPTARENSYIQRFYLYQNLTKPSRQLHLSYCKSGSDGKAMRPSYLVGVMQRLFPGLQVQEAGREDQGMRLEQVVSHKTGLPYLAEQLRQLREEEEKAEEGKEPQEQLWQQRGRCAELIRQYAEESEMARTAGKLTEAAFLVYGKEGLQRQTAAGLYGEILENSVTRLEQFAACEFAHFAAYGLLLRERETFQVRPADIGNIFHRALELFSRRLERSSYDWYTLPDEERERMVQEAVREAVEGYGSQVFFESARSRYTICRIQRILQRSAWALQEQIRAGRFVPSNFEVSFQAQEELEAVNIALGETGRLRLKGRIDRIDVCEEEDAVYVKVVDYKSGNTAFDLSELYYGLQLQLVVYLNAAMELERRLHPDKKMIPAGIFYYRMQDPLMESSHEQTMEEILEELQKKLRPDGIVNEEPDVVDRLDTGFEKTSRVIPVGRKKDGSLTAASSAVSQEHLEELSRFVQRKLQELGVQILKGEIGASPGRKKKEMACDHCAYASLCGFDARLPGAACREFAQLSEEEVWKRIKENDASDTESSQINGNARDEM